MSRAPRLPRASGPTSEAGVALVVAVLFALVFVLAGHGVLVLSRTQLWVAAADGERWAGEETRRGVLTAFVAGLDSLPESGVHSVGSGAVEVRTYGPELRLVVAEPETGRSGLGWAALLAAPRAQPRVASRRSAFQARAGVFVADDGTGTALPGDPCPIGLSGVALPVTGGLPGSDTLPRLGPMHLSELVAALPPLPGERLELVPPDPPTCDAPGSFGDPRRPGGCSATWGAGSRAGDLRLEGSGQGVLAVSGDLTVTVDSHFRGWVWVGGALTLERGATLGGLADVGGRLTAAPGARLEVDVCAAGSALEATDVLRRPRRVGPATWPLLHR